MTTIPRRRALMLINPNARRGSDSLDPVIARLEVGGVDVQVERFQTPGEVSADIERKRDEADLVIICGGDGTINSAAKGIMATGLPLGILPMGTANDLARTLAIPDNLLNAADIILANKTRKIDLGEVNGHPFFNVASMGLGASWPIRCRTRPSGAGGSWAMRWPRLRCYSRPARSAPPSSTAPARWTYARCRSPSAMADTMAAARWSKRMRRSTTGISISTASSRTMCCACFF